MNKSKIKSLATQFPNIYRFITESKPIKEIRKHSFGLLNQPKVQRVILILSAGITLGIILCFLGLSLLFGLRLESNTSRYISLLSERQSLRSQVNFWTSISEKYPGYKDAYFRIAVLEYRLSDFDKARKYNNKALLLDPNDKNAISLDLRLSGN